MKRAIVLAIAACSRRAELTSCDDDLRGVYVAGDERWMILDNGDTLEAYPLFPDSPGPDPHGPIPAGVIVAPRVIDFQRAPADPGAAGPGSMASSPQQSEEPPLPAGRVGLVGTLRRRYMRRAEHCDAHLPVHVMRCAGDTIELVLADPSPPLEYSPCAWSRPEPSRLVRWRRE